MTNVRVRHLELLEGHMPGMVRFVLADNDIEEEARVWIRAKLPVDKASNEMLTLIVREALVQMGRAIKAGIQDVDKEPSVTP